MYPAIDENRSEIDVLTKQLQGITRKDEITQFQGPHDTGGDNKH